MTPSSIPRYAELPVIEKTGERHAWTVFGEGDELGTMNFIGPEQVRGGLACATEGRVVNLALPLDLPSPALSGTRAGYAHHVERRPSGSVIVCRRLPTCHGNGASIRYVNPIGIAAIAPSVVDTSTSAPKPDFADIA